LDQGKAVPTFPILSRTVCGVLGEICPRGYLDLYIDVHLLDIFKQLRRLGHDRILYLEDVVFEHMHHVVGKAALEIYHKKNHRADEILFMALDDERASKAQLLARYIEARCKEQAACQIDSPISERRVFSEQKAGFRELLKRVFSFSDR
jgi:hypothetical protein